MRHAVALALLGVVACGDAETEPPPPEPPEPEACAPSELTLDDGSCQPAGVPAEGCAAGFEWQDRGCTAVLPASCERGMMALPGDTVCREVAPCGPAPWGDIPVDATTQFVDSSYSGADSDGSEARPWTDIQDGIMAAGHGAIVAIAEGRYEGMLTIGVRTVRLWGRCPALVEIAAHSGELAAVLVRQDAHGTEVRNLALSGPAAGLMISGSVGVIADSLWIHDTGDRGLDVEGVLGDTEVQARNLLIEEATEIGALMYGSEVLLEASVVRDTQPGAEGSYGRAVQMQDAWETDARATGTVRGSVLERSHQVGIMVFGADGLVESTLVRDTQPEAATQEGGRGMSMLDNADTAERTTAIVRSSVFEGNRELGIYISGAVASIETTSVRDTLAQVSDDLFGRGMLARDNPNSGNRSDVTVSSSLFERNLDNGIFVAGADARIDRTLVRDTLPQPATTSAGRGVNVQINPDTGQRGMITLLGSRVERSYEFGLLALASDMVVEDSWVSDTLGRGDDGRFGDGFAVVSYLGPASGSLSDSWVERSARAGVSVFAGALRLTESSLRCNAIALDGEQIGGVPPALEDGGGNACGCEEPLGECAMVSSNLEPPEAVD